MSGRPLTKKVGVRSTLSATISSALNAQHCIRLLVARGALRLGDIESRVAGDLPGPRHVGRAVRGPLLLVREQGIEHWFELALATRRIEHADGFIGARMEGGKAHHHANLLRIHELDLAHHGRIGRAGFAGGIEELNDGDGRIRGPEHR